MAESLTSEATIAVMQRDIEYTKESIDAMTTKLDEFIKAADQKYAAKYVERAMTAFVWIIVLGVLGTIVRLVLIKL